MPDRQKPRPTTHLELTIRYTILAERANIAEILQVLGGEAGGSDSTLAGGKAELVKVKAVPAPE